MKFSNFLHSTPRAWLTWTEICGTCSPPKALTIEAYTQVANVLDLDVQLPGTVNQQLLGLRIAEILADKNRSGAASDTLAMIEGQKSSPLPSAMPGSRSSIRAYTKPLR